ncbi:Mucin-3B [Chelonia mydas]|uniref:Mucin-3B n=1 Tax=Chelonia mydas TaxID=8469 RepID=M7BZV3_CHEMY|nr:Mucin-3B [Chelonia mydas]
MFSVNNICPSLFLPGPETVNSVDVERQGSVVVDHIVILALPVTEELNTKVENVAEQLKTQIEKAAENQNCNSSSCESLCAMMCFNASSADVSNGTMPKFNGTEYCQKAAPEGYGQFYFPNLTKSGLSCISNCTKSTPGFINCNYGQCQLTRAGPQCICSETGLYWYPTERCATRISKLAVGLGMAVAVLVIVSAILGVFLFRAKRMKTQFRSKRWDQRGCPTAMGQREAESDALGGPAQWWKLQRPARGTLGTERPDTDGHGCRCSPCSLHLDDDTEKWYENDYTEWNTAGSFCIRNEGANFDKGSDSTNSFKVNMESIDSSLPVHIQRPEIVVTQL